MSAAATDFPAHVELSLDELLLSRAHLRFVRHMMIDHIWTTRRAESKTSNPERLPLLGNFMISRIGSWTTDPRMKGSVIISSTAALDRPTYQDPPKLTTFGKLGDAGTVYEVGASGELEYVRLSEARPPDFELILKQHAAKIRGKGTLSTEIQP